LGSEIRHSSPVTPSIYQLIRAEAFDEAVLEKLIDDEAMSVLTLLFKTSEVSTVIPAPNGWAFDWDVATIIIVDCGRRGVQGSTQ
jgi:hypothetical protein